MAITADQRSEFSSFYHSLMRQLGDEGSAFVVFQDGRCVINLVSGESSPGLAWCEDTKVICYSACKGALAMAIAKLVAKTELSYRDPLGKWLPIPKDKPLALSSVGQLMSHCSGFVAFHEKVDGELIYDYDAICRLTLNESPWFSGKTLAYSPFLWGWLVSQLIEAVTGECFTHSVAGINYGAPSETEQLATLAPNLAPLKSYREHSLKRQLGPNGDPMTRSAFMNPSTLMVGHNQSSWTSAMVPAASGRASAFGLAAAYSDFLRSIQKDDPVSPATTVAQGICQTTQTPMAFSYGFMRPQGTIDTQFGSLSGGFGHSGAGGSFAFADITHGLAVAYVTRSLGQAMFLDQRGVELVTRLYSLLEIDDEL
ncbi:serine hydrolase [Umboniibacter marinipuniceus]|uniref:CubicO group peptidase (Beta-lactamase class C family) n=1 Tax=Umboniibacter marinipuniceus TaxID=569599 RepID=A0A3M0A697_9GAMM|nr:serine hydrolase domain-containing protein [Umboniibacter marinipuniceus]RMA79924.1 CubicO group peptidase (beta-lactamase class C family) [Umboniibacter marinipuniceus]